MPGTILVSVLEFMGLPLSSTSIKVSMGKTESLISEEGDFSFPLASLREDLIIKLQDSDGNEISRIGFHTKSIVEKGVWEDIFALGHGHLRLKLQFILNDEDRDRIRMMRQSALKKKHDELLSSSPRGSESDSASVGNAALAFRNDENLQKDTYNLKPFLKGKNLLVSELRKKTGPNIILGAEPDLMQLHPNGAVQYKEISSNKPLSEAFDPTKLKEKGLTKKPGFGSALSKDPQRAINSEEVVAISFRSSNQNEVAENNLIQPNPSNVRKMISAFEMQTGLAQDMRSPIKSPSSDHCSSTIETKASSKAKHSGKEKAWNKGPVGLSQGKYRCSSTNGAYIGTGAEASKNAKIDETEESKSKSSDGNGDEISGRPIKQAIKVAIIIGFGIFVLLTRQRKGR
ncbi:uncharacterized protein LOC114732161 isoform X2 [Neltuma alba]|uniref:uncharacterized protein LOC114732161 isoform X2 n=2 Tax=Neltuma alba TaxID=207710 RepID=UPI0010A4BD48|nr:uncharacterized protein LOC114732161 isoform X2 [Prosopis alba]